MLVVAVLFLVVLGASVAGLRTSGVGPRWPFLIAFTISGAALLALVAAMGIALAAGRESWNSWVSGTQLSEAVTLWVLLIVGPLLLATCVALLISGSILRIRERRRSQHGIVSAR